jgi:hypothetical protein
MSEYFFNHATYTIDALISKASSLRAEHRKVLREQVQKLLQALNS